MAMRDWSTGRVVAGWVLVAVIVAALWLITGTSAMKSALFFDYILQLFWIAIVIPAAAITYVWAHVHLSEPARSRLKSLLLGLTAVAIIIWLGFSCSRFR